MPSPSCRSCGVPECEAAFHRCLAADFSDAAYGAVHHLVVPTYGLQHWWYTEDFAADVVVFVRDHLDRPPSADERQLVRRATEGAVRVRTRHHQSRELAWTRSVGDVDHSTSARYVESVREWAASVASVIGPAIDR